jgi:hypothetical protein
VNESQAEQESKEQSVSLDWRASKGLESRMTNERKQREKAAVTRRAGDGAFVPDASRGELTGSAVRLAVEAASIGTSEWSEPLPTCTVRICPTFLARSV